MVLWYIYPIYKHVSFSVISQEHIAQLKKKFWVESLSDDIIGMLSFSTKPDVILHPYFYPLQRFGSQIKRFRDKINTLIGIDVADSDSITNYAVSLTEYANALIVPSNFSKNSFIRSGVKKPVYVIPHGIPEQYISMPKQEPIIFPKLDLVRKRGYVLLLSYIMHSEYRKGYDLLREIYTRVRKERENVRLVIKASNGTFLADKDVEDRKLLIEKTWLSEFEEMVLIDACDIYVLTSRGGGFEHPPLKAIARGLPVVAGKGGSWEDFLPSWALVESKPSGIVLEGNPIHSGKGIEIDVDRAVEKIIDMVDNLKEYKQKANEYAGTFILNNYTWDVIGEKLINVVGEVLKSVR